MRQYETYKCSKCGNVVEVQNVGGGELHCCGEAMKMITNNLTMVNLLKSFAGDRGSILANNNFFLRAHFEVNIEYIFSIFFNSRYIQKCIITL